MIEAVAKSFPFAPHGELRSLNTIYSMITLVMSLCVDALPVHVYGVSTITGLV
jgi:hypothetical protein